MLTCSRSENDVLAGSGEQLAGGLWAAVLLLAVAVGACDSAPPQEKPPPEEEDPCAGLPTEVDTVEVTEGSGSATLSGRIVFSAKDTVNGVSSYHLYSMEANGMELRQLTHGKGAAWWPAWSPGGQTIAYSGDSLYTTAGLTLWLIEADGTDPRPAHIRDEEGPYALVGAEPAWSPGGNELVYRAGGNHPERGIAGINAIELANESVRSLTDAVGDGHPSWSPDGEWVVFSSNRAYTDADSNRYREDLYRVRADGSELQRLTCTGHATHPKWSSDGSMIAYQWQIYEEAVFPRNVFLYDVETQEAVLLETGLGRATNPMWNADGSRLLVVGREAEGSPLELRLLKIEPPTYEVLRTVTLAPEQEAAYLSWYDWHVD